MQKHEEHNARDYENRFRTGAYMPAYPETHIVRIHRHVLEWELGLSSGSMLDFGCGTAANARYFADHGFLTYGCDTSEAAIAKARELIPEHAEHFFVVPPTQCDLTAQIPEESVDLFLSNQVLYYLRNAEIRHVVSEAYKVVKPGGAFVATMMSYGSYFSGHITEVDGEMKKVELPGPRVKDTSWINFARRDELIPLFRPFEKLHIGSYNTGQTREDEGPRDHWLFIGVKA